MSKNKHVLLQQAMCNYCAVNRALTRLNEMQQTTFKNQFLKCQDKNKIKITNAADL